MILLNKLLYNFITDIVIFLLFIFGGAIKLSISFVSSKYCSSHSAVVKILFF